MESFTFELKLVDNLERVSKRGSDALRGVERQAKKTQQALDFSKELGRAHLALAKLDKDPTGYKKLLHAQRELAEQRKKFGKESFTEALGSKVSFGKIFSAAALADVLVEGVSKVGEGLIEAAHAVVDIFTEGVAKAFEGAGKEQTRRLQYKLSLGAEGGKESLEDITRFAKLTQFTRGQIAPIMLKLRRAGFGQQAARSAFAAGADVEAGGGMSAADFADFAEHVKLKGGVTTKQLVGANINAPLFFKDLGKKLGISAKAAEKKAKQGGEIDPQLMLNTIYEGIQKAQGGKLGTGAGAASKTFEARFAKLKALPEEYFEKLVDSPAFGRVSDAFGDLLEKLDPESEAGQRIMGSLERMFESIAGKIANIDLDKLTDGIEDALSAAEGFLPVLVGLAEAAGDLAKFALDAASGFKLLMAIQSGDKAGAAAAAQEMQQRAYDKVYRDQERDAKKQGLGEGRGVLDATRTDDDSTSPRAISYAAMSATPLAPPVAKAAGGKQITLHVHPGAVTVQANPGEDSDHTHQRAGRAIVKHMTDELERAAQEAGG